jgi:UDP-2-acetamido-3-amino-2,3-dideoxy-glucuronate N-acetyltransferase
VLCGIEIGRYAMVGAGAVVTSSVAPYQVVYGNPAKPQGWVSREGYRLQFDEKGDAFCNEEGTTYRLRNGGVQEGG